MPAATKTEPELALGPFPGGIGVKVWLNDAQTDDGPKKIRSITISPRRYQDPDTGQWKDAASFRVVDLPALILALQRAHEHCLTTPLPGSPAPPPVDDEPHF